MSTTIAVLGDGAWGTAMALLLAGQPDTQVRLWSARPENAERLRQQRENVRFLPNVPIPQSIMLTADPAEATANADLWVSAVPTVYLRETIGRFRSLASPATPVVSLTKGIEIATFRRPTQIIEEILGTDRVATLSGPTHAEEVSRGMPTAAIAAGSDSMLTAQVQKLFSTDRFRVYTNSDLIGVEIAGALKNVIGIAAGIGDGLGYGDNAKSALLTRGLVEMSRFGAAMGGEPDTFHGLAGVGDLITTCFSPHGRNRLVGERLGKGETLSQILATMSAISEGVTTAKAVHERTRIMGLDMPITASVYGILYEGVPAAQSVNTLMSRKSGSERKY
ncbi:NAD(P)H-dependent glycerol-3-phosphate dehydrogenase [Zavarzinella formosa]|uniref:NAD(P)H-dependent glycerol-3-phosphate dehydrogenase n=1 Tax=Zavarzinella formosa TaxID=360055 RepID=UPI0002EF060C|nr:NAD(P)H-dependent glycerol-3-phosphate dehydrogenase [Zavarzinella formosa]